MALTFPAAPTTGDRYSFGDFTYEYDGAKWTSLNISLTHMKTFSDLASAIADTSLQAGHTVRVVERTTGYGGGAFWNVVANTGTEDGYGSVVSTGTVGLSLVIHTESSMSVTCFGESVTDKVLLQAALDSGATRVINGYGLTYSLSAKLRLPIGVEYDLNRSTMNFNTVATDSSIVVDSYTKCHNGTINHTAASYGGAGASHTCIEGGNQGTGVGITNVVIRDLTVHTDRVNGNCIVFFGQCNNIYVKSIYCPTSSTVARVVGMEWGGTSGGTGHPNNCVIDDVSAGTLSYSTVGKLEYLVWLSSVFNIKVSNVYSGDCQGLVGVFTGDESNVYAPAAYKDMVGSGITLNNISGRIRSNGIRIYGKGTAHATPLFQRPIINNPTIEGVTGAGVDEIGITITYSQGVQINNPNIYNCVYGVLTGGDVSGVIINNGEIRDIVNNGVRFAEGGSIPGVENCWVIGTKIYKCGTGLAANVILRAGVSIETGINCGVLNCNFGQTGVTETQLHSIYVVSDCINCDISDNHTYAIGAGGTSLINGTSTSYGINTTGRNNTADTGISTHAGTPLYTIDDFDNRHFTFAGSAGFPASGTWNNGDSFRYAAPTAYAGGVYSGGAWKSYGAIV